MKKKYIYAIAGGAVLLLAFIPSVGMSSNASAGEGAAVSLANALATADSFIPSVEGFSPTPYWDVNRYSWGYGTAAPGSSGTITRDQAASDMNAYIEQDWYDLEYQITRPLTANQWAALLSFSFNLGVGAAYNIVDDINADNDAVLEPHWKQYIYAAGVVNPSLVSRRAKEWQLWQS